MENIVQINGLTKLFGSNKAVDNVSMNIYKGDIYGFIGRNGAGKTTLIRVLLGLASKTSGNIKLFNTEEIIKARDKVGCIIENPGLILKSTARDNLKAQSLVMGIDLSDSQIDELLNLVGLDPNLKKKAKDFSLGMKQRLAIAIAMVGDPELLILDEPTNGLDPEGIRDIRNLILKLNKEKNITVLISSHILGELHKLASRYGVIDKGRIIEEFTAEELEDKTRENFEIIVNSSDIEEVESIIKELNLKYNLDVNKEKFVIYDLKDSNSVLKYITSKGIIPVSYHTTNADLEEYFLKLVGGYRNE